MTRSKCKICGKFNPIRADGICWNCYYKDYCAWSRSPEERVTYKEAMIDKFKATIVRMRKDVTTMEDVRLNRRGTKRNIMIMMIPKRGLFCYL